MIYREQGHKWDLPDKISVSEGYPSKWFSYRVLGFRPPKKGEYYLSGAVPAAYKAPSDLLSVYLVIELTGELVPKTIWVPKEES